MKRSATWAVVTIIVTVLALALLYVATRPARQTDQNQTPPSTQSAQPKTTTTPPQVTPDPGVYITYTPDALANAQGRRVLFFHAGWCPQCRAIEQDILTQGVPAGMTIVKINYDTATDLKQKYGVTMQTTIVEIDTSGNTVKKHVAYNEPTLVAILKALE